MSKIDEFIELWAGAPQQSVTDALRQELLEGGVDAILADMRTWRYATRDGDARAVADAALANGALKLRARVRELCVELLKEEP